MDNDPNLITGQSTIDPDVESPEMFELGVAEELIQGFLSTGCDSIIGHKCSS